jgi:hypothetical protein
MSIREHLFSAFLAGVSAAGFWAISTAGATAANVVFSPSADISVTPYVISFDDGAATFTLSDINDVADTFIVAVSTTGSAFVDSFVGFPSPFQQDSIVSDADMFSAFPSSKGILYSNGLVSIGLEFQLPDGVHFGYATVFGPEVVQYGYNATPGASIATGAAAPEPATWALMALGFAGLGLAGWRTRQRTAVAR